LPHLSKGLHKIIIEAQSKDGKTAQIQVEYYAPGS
jgi:hypothetical protein